MDRRTQKQVAKQRLRSARYDAIQTYSWIALFVSISTFATSHASSQGSQEITINAAAIIVFLVSRLRNQVAQIHSSADRKLCTTDGEHQGDVWIFQETD